MYRRAMRRPAGVLRSLRPQEQMIEIGGDPEREGRVGERERAHVLRRRDCCLQHDFVLHLRHVGGASTNELPALCPPCPRFASGGYAHMRAWRDRVPV